MKKGCFLSFVVFGTIIIGTTFYIIDKYGSDIIDFGKEKVTEISFNSVEDYFDKIDESPYKDSLLITWNNFFESTKKMEFEERINLLSSVSLQIEKFAKDSVINSTEMKKIREFIENETIR